MLLIWHVMLLVEDNIMNVFCIEDMCCRQFDIDITRTVTIMVEVNWGK